MPIDARGLLQQGRVTLIENGVDSTPILDCELLLCHILGISRAKLLCDDIIVNDVCVSRFWELIAKRKLHCPISHLVGRRAFWDSDFYVNKHVLDPRADSETIIHAVMKRYVNRKAIIKIADFGTGSGCLIISLLKYYSRAHGIAFESSVKAYQVAVRNMLHHRLRGRLKILLGSWCRFNGDADIVISNPPYIERLQMKHLDCGVKFYEPSTALDGGVNGLSCYFEIFYTLQKYLRRSAIAVLEIGHGQKRAIISILPRYKLTCIEVIRDLGNIERCLVIRKLH